MAPPGSASKIFPHLLDAPAAIVGFPVAWAERGSHAYRRISLALFLAGFATFSLLYCVQPLLPAFTDDFHVSPAESSLALSLTTGFLALAILCAGAVSEAIGRRGLMFGSMLGAAALNIVAAVVPGWHALLIARALEGFVLGGVPAVAMAYLAEEIHPRGLGLAMGLYVGGTAFGGMIGRVGIGMLTEFASWRVAMGVLGLVDLAVALGFIALLPSSRNFVRRPGFDHRYHLNAWGGHLGHISLPLLFAVGFLVMGAFVTIYNYAGFRLMAPPYNLSQTGISVIFAGYLFGIAASSMAGRPGGPDRPRPGADNRRARRGRGAGADPVAFPLRHRRRHHRYHDRLFHSSCSLPAGGWAGIAAEAKGHAASLYLLAYYLGSSLMGSLGGWFWGRGGWPQVAAFTAVLLLLALAAAMRLNALASRARS